MQEFESIKKQEHSLYLPSGLALTESQLELVAEALHEVMS